MSKRFARRVAVASALTLLTACGGAQTSTRTADQPTTTIRSRRCPPLPQRIVTGIDNQGSDAHLGASRGAPKITCTQAIRNDRHPTGSLPVIGVRLMNFTSVRFPKGRLVWVIATTPGTDVPNGGPVVRTNPATTATTTPRRYAFSIDLIDAHTGRWLEGLTEN